MLSRRRTLPLALAAVLLAALPAGAGAAPRPDLVQSSVSVPSVSTASGAMLSVTDRARNAGGRGSRRARTAFYLSTDRTRSAGDRALGGRSLPALRSRRSSRRTTSVRIPDGVSGDFYVIACADSGRKVRESNERNNCRASAGRISVGTGSGGGGGTGPTDDYDGDGAANQGDPDDDNDGIPDSGDPYLGSPGDGTCQAEENAANAPQDCPGTNGDGICNPLAGENETTAPGDCSLPCAPFCPTSLRAPSRSGLIHREFAVDSAPIRVFRS